MKFVAFAFAATLGLGTGVAYLNSINPFNAVTPSFTAATSSENITVPAVTVSGNIVDQRLSNTAKPTLNPNKKVTKVSVNASRVIYLDTEVSFASSQQLANSVKELAAKSSEPIWLLIDSPGGSVIDGETLIAEMQVSRAPVYTVCTRLCASMAAMIHSYGAKRYATDGAILMYHPASAAAEGQVPNMVSQMTTLTRYLDKMVANVVSRSKLSLDDYNRLVPYELWIDAEDSEVKGLIDGIINLNVPYFQQSDLNVGNLEVSPTPPTKTQQPLRQPSLQYISPYLKLWDRH